LQSLSICKFQQLLQYFLVLGLVDDVGVFDKEAVVLILLIRCLRYPLFDEVAHEQTQVFAVLLSSVSSEFHLFSLLLQYAVILVNVVDQ